MRLLGYEVHPACDAFPMLGEADLDLLADDIKSRGLIEPATLAAGVLVDGRNRLMACKRAGVEPRAIEWHGKGSVTDWIVSKNLRRRHLDESQRAMVGAKLEPVYAAEAKERMLAGKRADPTANLPEGATGEAREKAAAQVNVSPRSVQAAKTVLAKAAPSVVKAVEAGKISVSMAAEVAQMSAPLQATISERVFAGAKAREAMRQARREELSKRVEPLPDKKAYRVIYADPPWQYNDSRAGLEGYSATAAEDNYPTMSVADLCALGIGNLAAPDAVLFCWATFPLLPDALDVVKAWGFTYKTAFVWSKGRANFGHYHNASAELLLVCTRGSCTPDADKRESQVQVIERTGRHSSKPEEFRALVDRLYPNGERLELFRRGLAPVGWDVWGNEVSHAA